MYSLTIAIINYKGLKNEYFIKSLHSAMSQICCCYQIVIYNETEDVIKYMHVESRRIPKNICGNAVKIREYIIKSTHTDYLAFWDSDDVFTVDRLSKQMEILVEKRCDLCFANFGFFDDKRIHNESFFERIGFGNRKINILDENYVGFGICTAKTSFLKKLLPFPQITTLDWWIAIKCIFIQAKLCYVEKMLGYYRIHDNSLSFLYHHVSIEDFIKEKNNKIVLYQQFESFGAEFANRISYYKNLDVQRNYKKLQKAFTNSKYKNFWGGLMKYERK